MVGPDFEEHLNPLRSKDDGSERDLSHPLSILDHELMGWTGLISPPSSETQAILDDFLKAAESVRRKREERLIEGEVEPPSQPATNTPSRRPLSQEEREKFDRMMTEGQRLLDEPILEGWTDRKVLEVWIKKSHELLGIEILLPTNREYMGEYLGGAGPYWARHLIHLRSHSPDIQKDFLTGVFGREGFDYQNGEQVGVLMAELNNIDWFTPKEATNPPYLRQMVDDYFTRLNLPPLETRIIEEDWGAIMDDTEHDIWLPGVRWDEARPPFSSILEVARDSEREGALGWVQHMALWSTLGVVANKAKAAAWPVGLAVSGAATWTVVEDLMPSKGYSRGNPYIPLISMYKRGYVPVGVTGDKFTVFSPLAA